MSPISVPRLTLVLALVALLAVNLVPASIATHTIQPGDRVTSSVGGCTLNFVYDGTGSLSGRTFIGTAAHCVRRPGDIVSIGHYRPSVFYVGDTPNAINGDGRPDNGYAGHQLDFALIDVTGLPVGAQVRGHAGAPDGFATPSETGIGDRVLLSGHGTGFQFTQQTREMRQGLLTSDSSRSFTAAAPALPGDSGGPVLVDGPVPGTPQALGIASTIGGNGLAGPTVNGVIAELAGLGIGIQLRNA